MLVPFTLRFWVGGIAFLKKRLTNTAPASIAAPPSAQGKYCLLRCCAPSALFTLTWTSWCSRYRYPLLYSNLLQPSFPQGAAPLRHLSSDAEAIALVDEWMSLPITVNKLGGKNRQREALGP